MTCVLVIANKCRISYFDLGYGIATPKGSKWRDKISKAILFLQEKGVIQMYYDKWWKSHGRWTESDCKGKGEGTLEQKVETKFILLK